MNIRDEVMQLVREACRASGHSVPAGAESAAVDTLEREIGFPLPIELREWLQACNGPRVQPEVLFGALFDGSSASIEAHYEFVPEWRVNRWVPITGDGCGDYYVLDPSVTVGATHPVYFVDQEDYTIAAYVVASGLWQFLRFRLIRSYRPDQREDPYWPFDREQVLAEDPELELYQGEVPLPWDA